MNLIIRFGGTVEDNTLTKKRSEIYKEEAEEEEHGNFDCF
jgi:hypothetical protein